MEHCLDHEEGVLVFQSWVDRGVRLTLLLGFSFRTNKIWAYLHTTRFHINDSEGKSCAENSNEAKISFFFIKKAAAGNHEKVSSSLENKTATGR